MSLLHINSQYRSSGTFDNFTVNIGNQSQQPTKCKLLDVSIPQSMYNINSNNNIITFTEGTSLTVHTATIPVGNYASSDVLTIVPTAMNSATPAPSGTYSDNLGGYNMLLQIQSTVSFNLLFGTANNAWKQLGFSNTTYSSTGTTGAYLILSPYPVNFALPSYLYLDINGLGFKPCNKALSQPTAGTIPLILNGNSWTISNWVNDYDIVIPMGINRGSLDITLRNADGSLSGIFSDWCMTLMFN